MKRRKRRKRMISSGQARANARKANKLYAETLERFYGEIKEASLKGYFKTEISFSSKDDWERQTLEAVRCALEQDNYEVIICDCSVTVSWF
jgi:hypothetical protein